MTIIGEPINKKNVPLKYLPGYSRFLMKELLTEFAVELLRISREEDVPLLRYFASFTEEEFIKLGTASAGEMLSYLSENNLAGYIDKSTNDFIANRLPNVEREEIIAEDITLVSLVRRKAFRNFLPRYTTDLQVFAHVMEDVDRFVVLTEAASFNAYNKIQQENITRINKELAQREAELLEAQDLAGMGSFFWDLSGVHSVYTPGALKIFSLSGPSNLASFMEDVHPNDRDKLRAAMDMAFTGDGVFDCEYTYTKDGVEKRISSRGIVNFADGKPESMKGTVKDITKEYKLLRDLQENEQNFKQLIYNAPDGVIVITKESVISLWNPKAEYIFGWTADEAIGNKLTDTIIPVSYHEAHEHGIKRFLRTGEAHVMNKTLELTARNKAQQEFPISITISQTTQGGKIAFVAFIRDISQQKLTQAELQKKTMLLEYRNEELKQINKELETFNFAASHDLQEPLRKMQTYTSRIMQINAVLPPGVASDLEKIQKASARMQRLMEDLLTYSQNTLRTQDKEEVDLHELIDEVKNTFISNVEESRITINVGVLPVVKVVRFQFLQLFLNLLTNAIKYQPEGNTPIINIFSDNMKAGDLPFKGNLLGNKYLRITVSDNGIGFEQQYADRIFDLFSRLHHKDQYSGTGIGLATCKKIIQNHDGIITAEGEPGKGARFIIYLPAN